MGVKTAAEVLERHNKWRRGGSGPQTDPKELGEAIDCVCAALKAQGEPVAWMFEFHELALKDPVVKFIRERQTADAIATACGSPAIPLYTAPQPDGAQGDPVYQCRHYSSIGKTECAGNWFDCDRDVWESATHLQRRTLYTAPQPESQPAQAEPAGIQPFLENAFITCESDGLHKRYSVVLKFPTLAEAQDLHRYIVTLPAPAPGGDES